ncbi:glycerophosphodiester phosphodiesterase [Clavibacter nebraskensis]|uniref:GlpQ2 protein n=4 Tax=Clavibacter nebraskensis TaxID=31963 RepID=A0AAI8ZII6_9MICO|nr:glycerophosphodiester phosphodiesterase family protein [Clavibacter nebraskensis]KXU20828.1 glycerophosphodiester phosphodiesterase [Clavibacter nebraskensis]OAH20624.1 glycerophosphodiester phosphodiesterase [Clavibacter nebraskensis]QGV69612.1 glycerophosphodiester phosphodiesterase [Clavibacter nebraskensis]QGV72402.1 glycerophosphodiester phosphodiesterase [Clavibacter nebraskensis]UKF26991.1 glycerophosphodiester phosphodiesterase [Clavibacter nebraskensis]
MTRGAWFSGDVPRVLAHRGWTGSGAVENTLDAFRAAWELGVTHLETDVHVTADGACVLWHDADLRRLTGRRGRVRDSTLAELRAIDLGSGARVATLAELLADLPDARLNIDVKGADAPAAVARAIRAADAVDRVLVTSFSGSRRRRALALLPGAATSADAGRLVLAVLGARLGLAPVVRLALRGVDAVQMPCRGLGIRTVSPATVGRLARAVREVHVWTVDDPYEMIRLVRAGVHGVVTDRSDLALAALGGRDWDSPGNRGS